MTLTKSTMRQLGSPAPDFELLDAVSKKELSLDQLSSDHATVIMFICNHCPYVQHVIEGLIELADEYGQKGISFVGINSNDVETYPEDSPEKMKQYADRLNYPFPYLYDETQEVAKSYGAVCTPDFFVYDKDLKLIYRGRMDDSSPGNQSPVTGKDLRQALDAVLAGETPALNQLPSMGCNIKWRSE